MLLTPYETSQTHARGYANQAQHLLKLEGDDAYQLSQRPPGLTLAMEVALARQDLKSGLGELRRFLREGSCSRVLRKGFLPVLERGARTAANAWGDYIVGLMTAWHGAHHESCGRPVYEVSTALAEKLKYTELRGLTTNDLRLPQKNIFVFVPEEVADLHILARDPAFRVRGFYITEDLPYPDAAKDMSVGYMPNYKEDFTGRVWRILAVSCKPGDAQDMERMQPFTIPLPDGALADDVFALIPKEIVGWTDIFRWAMNVVIYSTWPEADVEHVIADKEARQLWERMERQPKGKKRDELRERFKALDPLRRTYLGRHVARWTPEERAGVLAQVEGQPALTRIRVVGHWRRYHVGEGRKDLKWNWIEPYWKGPVDAPLSETASRRVLTTAPKHQT